MAQDWGSSSRRIVVFRALNLGDMLCAVPTLRSLRAAFPAAEIVLVGLPWAREFAERYHFLLDGFREFPGFPGLPERQPELCRLPAFFESMQSEHFDLAIQLHGSGLVSNQVVFRFGARVTAGFYDPGTPCPGPDTFLPYPSRGLELRRLLRLLEHLGAPSCGEHLEFPIRPEEVPIARRLVARCEGRDYACVHAGASVAERRWPLEWFAIVADALAAQGLAIVLPGTSRESELAADLSWAMRSEAIDLSGRTTLGTLAAVLSNARMLICNDTGVSHLADALQVPSVVISTGDNPDRWAPADHCLHRVLCRAGGVSPSEVICAAEDLLFYGPEPALVASLGLRETSSCGVGGGTGGPNP